VALSFVKNIAAILISELMVVVVLLDPIPDLGAHLFVNVPRPGDIEGTFAVFESSFHLLLPVNNH